MGLIYLIHFDVPYKHAKHYIGYCEDGRLAERMKEHRSGQGARLIAVVNAAGIGWQVAKTFDGGRNEERRLKNRGGAARLCPICKGVHTVEQGT